MGLNVLLRGPCQAGHSGLAVWGPGSENVGRESSPSFKCWDYVGVSKHRAGSRTLSRRANAVQMHRQVPTQESSLLKTNIPPGDFLVLLARGQQQEVHSSR